MLKKLYLILQLSVIFFIVSCTVYKPVVSTSGSNLSTGDYINKYKDLAVSEMKRTGVPASITLAQGMLESDYGRSRLAREANNHFGIKCHSDWTGLTIRHNDDKRSECFRKYSKPEESFYDHSDFLKSESRYRFLFGIEITDYKSWARGLKKAGYATNPDYANMLIRKIEENNLWNFDRGLITKNVPPEEKNQMRESVAIPDSNVTEQTYKVLDENIAVPAHVSRVLENNRIQYIIAKEGDSIEKIEKEFQLLKWELQKYNELNSNFILVPGLILYLQPKREKAEFGREFHNTVEGDTMYLISQRYGIKLKSLYEMNRMKEGVEPKVGSKIWLRSIKPVN